MRRVAVVAAVLLGLGIAGGFYLGRAIHRRGAAEPDRRTPPEPSAPLRELQASYHEAVRFVMPSVVHITNTLVIRRTGREVSISTGSGVVVSAEGHILTNAHVIARAEAQRAQLIVRTSEGEEFRDVKVVGIDPPADIAVLKVQSERPLIPARLADSDAVAVGDLVLAIGSPFDLPHTVTQGIVSAVKRKLGGRSIYDEVIQTDASINPGNSGGALINLRGEVIGITTRILSESEGIGFAIPSNLARWVMERLIDKGRVERGFLGAAVVDIDEQLVREEFQGTDIKSLSDLLADLGLERAEGAFVKAVTPGSPAERARLKEGDVVVEYARQGAEPQKVRDSKDLVFKVADTPPGTTVVIKIRRDRQTLGVEVELAARPER
jgi:serine protease Do